MRTITATEASRSFAALLDEVEAGGTLVVTRGGRRVAAISPAEQANGAEVRALLSRQAPDPDFAADVAAARATVTEEDPAWGAD